MEVDKYIKMPSLQGKAVLKHAHGNFPSMQTTDLEGPQERPSHGSKEQTNDRNGPGPVEPDQAPAVRRGSCGGQPAATRRAAGLAGPRLVVPLKVQKDGYTVRYTSIEVGFKREIYRTSNNYAAEMLCSTSSLVDILYSQS